MLVAGLRALASDEEPSTLGTLTYYSGKGKREGGSFKNILGVRVAGWRRHDARKVTTDVPPTTSFFLSEILMFH